MSTIYYELLIYNPDCNPVRKLVFDNLGKAQSFLYRKDYPSGYLAKIARKTPKGEEQKYYFSKNVFNWQNIDELYNID